MDVYTSNFVFCFSFNEGLMNVNESFFNTPRFLCAQNAKVVVRDAAAAPGPDADRRGQQAKRSQR